MPTRSETLACRKQEILRTLIVVCANLRALQTSKNAMKAYLEVEKFLKREVTKIEQE